MSARCSGLRQELFDKGVEAFAVDGFVEQAGRFDAVVAQRGEEGRRLPAAMRNLVDEPLSALDARIRAGLREDIRALQRKPASPPFSSPTIRRRRCRSPTGSYRSAAASTRAAPRASLSSRLTRSTTVLKWPRAPPRMQAQAMAVARCDERSPQGELDRTISRSSTVGAATAASAPQRAQKSTSFDDAALWPWSLSAKWPLWADLCRSRVMLEGECPAQSCRSRRPKLTGKSRDPRRERVRWRAASRSH